MDVIKLFGGGFPLTTNRLEFLQSIYTKAFYQFAKLAGDGNIILDGIVKTGGNISAGVAIIDGEILEFRAGIFNSRIAIFEDVVYIPYNEDVNSDGNLDLKTSDVTRYLKCSAAGGTDPFLYNSFERIGNVQQNSPLIGEKKEIFGNIIPNNWLLCHGQTLNIVDEPRLFLHIGTTYGSGETGTFKLPDTRDRGTKGTGGNYSLGDSGGLDEVVLSEAQMSRHKHGGSTSFGGAHTHYGHVKIASGDWRGGGEDSYPNSTSNNGYTNAAGNHYHTINTDYRGNDQPHENRSPFLAVNIIIFKGY